MWSSHTLEQPAAGSPSASPNSSAFAGCAMGDVMACKIAVETLVVGVGIEIGCTVFTTETAVFLGVGEACWVDCLLKIVSCVDCVRWTIEGGELVGEWFDGEEVTATVLRKFSCIISQGGAFKASFTGPEHASQHLTRRSVVLLRS